MTRVEEAKKIAFQNFYKGAHGCFEVDVERVIAAARAEGAEALKAEIREHSDRYTGDPCVEGGSYYVVLDAVLAPKEMMDGRN